MKGNQYEFIKAENEQEIKKYMQNAWAYLLYVGCAKFVLLFAIVNKYTMGQYWLERLDIVGRWITK